MLVIVELGALAVGVEVATGRGNLVGHLVRGLLVNAVPHHVDNLLAVHPLENPVAPNQKEVEVVLDLERNDLWLAHNYVCVAAVSRLLGFNVAEGSGDREAAGENS